MKQSERQEIVELIMHEIRTRLDDDGIVARVEGRPKRLYSIYKKMKGKVRTLDQIFDLYAVRVLVDDVGTCYEVLGRMHEMYMPVPGRFKDFIGMKKPNGYQSLHTTLVGPGEPFEVQVRTYQMHSVAEYGIAAHWKYKEGGQLAKDKWLQEIMDLQRDMSGSAEYLDALKMDLDAFNERIYCFTPKGELIPLLSGACAIDYAYAIHSAVGNRMIGARVNGKMVSVDHELQTGDQVEVITSQNTKGPSRDWLKLVKTHTARTKITQWFNKESREENISKGREALEISAMEVESENKIPLDELLKDGREKDILERFNCKSIEQLYVMIGVGGLREKLVINHLHREYEKTLPPPSDEELIQNLIDVGEKLSKPDNNNRSGVTVRGVGDTAVRFARCCGPMPGDEILGYVTRGRGLTVHRTDCVNVIHMDELDRRRLIEAQWQMEIKRDASFHTDMRINCDNRDGLLVDISRILFEEKVNVKMLNTRTSQGETVMHLGLEVSSGQQLQFLTKKLQNVQGVHEIIRVSS
jgi:GTP pyrophosphokinase